MRVTLTSNDIEFCNRTRLAFAREGSAVQIAGRGDILLPDGPDEDVILVHADTAAGAARWCRVTRQWRRIAPLIACCDRLESTSVAAVLDAGADDVVPASIADRELLARV